MHIQLWSYNYDPEPTGIAPLSSVWARTMRSRGHRVEIVAAHPHYPEPRWGMRRLPYREQRDGLSILRLPLWIGRATAAQRIRQEATFAAALSLAAPILGTPDAIVAVSPSFPALGPTIVNARLRRVPWVLWVQDILPDGASATGLLDDGRLVRAARRFELAAYRSAERVVVISGGCADNLLAKGVPSRKLIEIYNPASGPIAVIPRRDDMIDPRLVMTMGNIGHSQDLVRVTRAFEESAELAELGARFVLVGDGVAGDDLRSAIRTERVTVTGIVHDSSVVAAWLDRAAVALVSQRCGKLDWNLPSKLMNFMGHGVPIVAAVHPDSEVAKIVRASGAGWVSDNRDSSEVARAVASALRDPTGLRRRGDLGREFAAEHFSPARTTEKFQAAIEDAVAGHRHRLN